MAKLQGHAPGIPEHYQMAAIFLRYFLYKTSTLIQ